MRKRDTVLAVNHQRESVHPNGQEGLVLVLICAEKVDQGISYKKQSIDLYPR